MNSLSFTLLIICISLVFSVPLEQFQEDNQEQSPPHLRIVPQKVSSKTKLQRFGISIFVQKWDRYGMGFGSDGYLYDFVKRAPRTQRFYSPKYFGMGSDGYLYDFVKRAPSRSRGPGYRRYNYGFGSDGISFISSQF